MATLINNIDVNAQGIYLARHGAEELFTLPNLSDAEVNDWQEVDGLQVDFTTVQLQRPDVVVRYVVTSLAARSALEQYHKAESIKLTPHCWERSFTLRKAQPESTKVYGRIGSELAMEIVYRYELDDIPTASGAPTPLGGVSPYKIGGVDLHQYGVAVNKVYDTLLAPNSYKERTFVRRSKEVQMQCAMFAPMWAGLWINRAALWSALQGELSLTTSIGTTKARYLSCSSPRQIGNEPAISFTLNLQLI